MLHIYFLLYKKFKAKNKQTQKCDKKEKLGEKRHQQNIVP